MELTPAVAVEAAPWIAKAAREYGIFAIMVCFFTWWSYAREGQLNARIDAQDMFIRETLVHTVDNNTKAFERFEARLVAQEKR